MQAKVADEGRTGDFILYIARPVGCQHSIEHIDIACVP